MVGFNSEIHNHRELCSSGANPEVIGDVGVVVPQGDVKALGAAIERLLSNPGLSADLAARAYARMRTVYRTTPCRKTGLFLERRT